MVFSCCKSRLMESYMKRAGYRGQVNVLSKAPQLGLVLAVVGLSMVIIFPTTQLTLFLSSVTLFIGSMVGLVHMLLANVKPADLEGHRGILGIARSNLWHAPLCC